MWFRTFRESREDPNEHIHRTPSSLIALGLTFGLIAVCYFVVSSIFPDFPKQPSNSDLRWLLVAWPLALYGYFHKKLRRDR
jgi:hypothetical protein